MKRVLCMIIGILGVTGCMSKTITKQGSFQNQQGNEIQVTIKQQKDQIIEVMLDELEQGVSKKQQKEAYGMKQASPIQKEWYEQIEALEQYVEQNGVEAIALDEAGKATNEELRSVCSIRIDAFLKAMKETKEKQDS